MARRLCLSSTQFQPLPPSPELWPDTTEISHIDTLSGGCDTTIMGHPQCPYSPHVSATRASKQVGAQLKLYILQQTRRRSIRRSLSGASRPQRILLPEPGNHSQNMERIHLAGLSPHGHSLFQDGMRDAFRGRRAVLGGYFGIRSSSDSWHQCSGRAARLSLDP